MYRVIDQKGKSFHTRFSLLNLVEGEEIKTTKKFHNEYCFENKSIFFENCLYINLKTASDMNIANYGCSRRVKQAVHYCVIDADSH